MIIFGLNILMVPSSLFFSAQERAAIERLEHSNIPPNPTEKEEMPLVLNGILYRPDLDHWIVWINGVRIYSKRPQSIQGWTIIKVNPDSIIVRSKSGEERELRPEQDPELEEFNAVMEDGTTEDSDAEKPIMDPEEPSDPYTKDTDRQEDDPPLDSRDSNIDAVQPQEGDDQRGTDPKEVTDPGDDSEETVGSREDDVHQRQNSPPFQGRHP